MEIMLDLFPNLVHYLELMPVACVALLSGAVSYFNLEGEASKCAKAAIRVIATSAFLALLVYSILSATDLPYLAKVGISAAVGYFGIDKTLELVQKIIALRNNGGQDDDTKTAKTRANISKARSRNPNDR